MNIFFLTYEFVWPPLHGGRVRSLSQLRLLGSLPEVTGVTLLGLTEVDVTAAERDALAREVPGVEVLPPVHHPIHLRRRPLALLRVAGLRLLRGVPYLAGKWDGAAVRAELVRRLSATRYDVVYIDNVGMAHYLPEVRRLCPGARVVIEAHNVESDFFKQFAQELPPPLRQLARREWRAARRFESQVLGAVDAVVTISSDDARVLAEQAGARAVVVPQVVRFSRKERPRPSAPRLCYVGSLNWRPNTRGLDWFCAEVWPLVRRRLPAATLVIAGSGLPTDASGRSEVPAAWRTEGVETVGFLDDLEPMYQRSCGMIAPILDGSGIRIKLLEALRAGMPVVTTPQGAAGLPLKDGEHALIEGDPARFAAAAVRLLEDAPLGARLREAGYRYLETHHAQSVAQRAMREALGSGS